MFPAATVAPYALARNIVHRGTLAIFSRPFQVLSCSAVSRAHFVTVLTASSITFHQGESHCVTFTCPAGYRALHSALQSDMSNIGGRECSKYHQGIHILPVPPRIASRSCYGLSGAVLLCCAAPGFTTAY